MSNISISYILSFKLKLYFYYLSLFTYKHGISKLFKEGRRRRRAAAAAAAAGAAWRKEGAFSPWRWHARQEEDCYRHSLCPGSVRCGHVAAASALRHGGPSMAAAFLLVGGGRQGRRWAEGRGRHHALAASRRRRPTCAL